MKEVTYEDWLKNPTPRSMWVWDEDDSPNDWANIVQYAEENLDKAFKAIAELEKENAELKEQCSVLADCNTCHFTCKNENIEMKKQLTKAKEIVQKLCDIVCGRSGDDWELIKQAEQFLREVK